MQFVNINHILMRKYLDQFFDAPILISENHFILKKNINVIDNDNNLPLDTKAMTFAVYILIFHSHTCMFNNRYVLL